MTKELFVATSYHHVLTAIAKKYANHSAMDLFISNRSTGDEYWKLYLEQMKANKWFGNIFFFDERSSGPPSPAHPLATYRYELGGERKLIAQIQHLNLKEYDRIYLIDDKMFLGSTIVRDKLPYHLCEDTVLTYQMMKKAKSSKVMNAPYNIICPILKAFNYWHPVFGYGKSCEAIESSSGEGLPEMLPKNKILVVDRMELINSIPAEEKEKLCEMFLDKENLEYMRQNSDAVMLMTCPIVKDAAEKRVLTDSVKRFVSVFPTQIAVMEKLLRLYPGKKIIIKPHPRDDTDYKAAFPDAVVLRRTFPSEIFSFLDGIEIEEAVSIGSTSVNSCEFARRKRLIMINELEQLRPPSGS